MWDGVDIIYQAVLADDTWSGRADFLRKVDLPGDLGKWSSIHQKKHKWVRVLNHEFHGGYTGTMARPLRIAYPGAIYHVTSRSNARQAIYALVGFAMPTA